MGYNDNECVICYSSNSSNGSNSSNKNVKSHNICGECVDFLMRLKSNHKYIHSFSRFLEKSSNCGDNTICFLCKEKRYLTFYAPCCNYHEDVFEMKDEEIR